MIHPALGSPAKTTSFQQNNNLKWYEDKEHQQGGRKSLKAWNYKEPFVSQTEPNLDLQKGIDIVITKAIALVVEFRTEDDGRGTYLIPSLFSMRINRSSQPLLSSDFQMYRKETLAKVTWGSWSSGTQSKNRRAHPNVPVLLDMATSSPDVSPWEVSSMESTNWVDDHRHSIHAACSSLHTSLLVTIS